jgi:hypothetical protein
VIRFVEPPAVGTVIELIDSQSYRVVRHQPGFAPIIWRTRCLETGIEFEFSPGLTLNKVPRRPPGHRHPGRRVAPNPEVLAC